MALTRERKDAVIAEVRDILKDAGSVVFVQFKGLPLKDTTAMRRALREKDVLYRVAKKTLVKRALKERGYGGDEPALEGELAIAYGVDSLAPAREVLVFQKKHKDAVTILGGVFEDRYQDKGGMMEIAQIPGREALLAQFAQLINSPIQRFAVVLDQIAASKE